MAGVGAPHVGGARVAPPVGGGKGAPRGNVPRNVAARAASAHVAQAHAAASGGGVANRPANWLQPLTPAQVAQQAESMVRTSYAPAYNALNQETAMENGILTKQESDNQFYQKWLDAKSNALMANEAQVNKTTNDLEQQLTGNQTGAYEVQPQELTASANARPGNVSNNAVSFTAGESALGNALHANQQGTEAELGGAARQALSVENTEANSLGSAIANTGAVVAAGQARETGAYNTAMMKIASERATLSGREAGALMSELARLQGVQISLSENNRAYGTAVAKLGIQAANVNSEIAQRAASTQLNQQKFQETVSQNQFNDWVKNQQLAQNQQKIAVSLMNAESNAALRRAEIAKDSKTGFLTQSEQNTIYDSIQKATGTLNGLIQQGMDPHAAYAAVLNGYYVTTKTTSSGKTERIRVTVPRTSNQSLLNAAYNTSTAGGGLTPGDVHYLTLLHMDPSQIPQRLKVQPAPLTGSQLSTAVTQAVH